MSESIKWQELTAEQRDRLVHEKVMKQSVDTGECEHRYGTFEVTCPSCRSSWEEYSPNRSHLHGKGIPHYTQSLDAAWQVVEKINAGNFTLERVVNSPIDQQISSTPYSDKHHFYEAAFYLGENWQKTTQTYHNQANTPHEAICIAALRASGIEVVV